MRAAGAAAVFLLLHLSAGGLSAAEEPAERPGPLTLEQARVLALANSRSIALSNLAVKNAILEERAALYAMLPSLSADAGGSASLWNAQGGTSKISDTLGASLGFSVSQGLFRGGKGLVQRAINAIGSEMARQEAQAAYFGVLKTADDLFFGALEAAAGLEAAESSLETAALGLSIAETRFQNRMLGRSDYLAALAEKESKENERNRARRDLILGREKLKNLTGLPELPDLEAADFEQAGELLSALAGISGDGIAALNRRFQEAVHANNPSLARTRLAGQQAEKGLSLAKRDYAPNLGASFATGLTYDRTGGLRYSSGRLSLSGSIPLDFHVIANNVEKKKIARDTAVLNGLEAEELLKLEAEAALLDAAAQAESALSAGRACEYAEEHFSLVLERFRLSQNSVPELSDAAALLQTNRTALIRSRYGFLRSLSALRTLGAFASDAELAALLLSAAGETAGPQERRGPGGDR
jgi:outer membrane protein TolC